MAKPKILVTGATGRTGGAVAAELIRAGFPVRALVRQDDERSRALAASGMEIAIADMCDHDRVRAAMDGVSRAYFLPPFDPNALHGAAVFAAAAADARLEAITALSQWLASPAHPSRMTRQLWLMEQLFAHLPGTALTIVNPGIFADTPYLSTIEYAVHLGTFPAMFGESRNAPPSVADIARVCAAALIDPQRHGGQRYRPTGPELLDTNEMAAAIGRAVGRSVHALPMPLWMFMRAARLDGFSAAVLSEFPHYVEDHRQGAFELGAPNDVVQQVTGREAETFEAIARRHAARVKRGFGPAIRQFAKFMAVPLVPGFDAARYHRALRTPFPVQPRYAIRSGTWRAEHGISPGARPARDTTSSAGEVRPAPASASA